MNKDEWSKPHGRTGDYPGGDRLGGGHRAGVTGRERREKAWLQLVDFPDKTDVNVILKNWIKRAGGYGFSGALYYMFVINAHGRGDERKYLLRAFNICSQRAFK